MFLKMNTVCVRGFALAILFGCNVTSTYASPKLDRTQLPIPEGPVPSITERDARNAKVPPYVGVTAPAGAPNVVVVLIDDMGFGIPSAFGGAVKMATAERLANGGLRYNRFHTTALCSPTRVALLTGRNHHVNNAGAIMELATGFPGNTGIRPKSVAPLAEMLQLNGFSTAAFGKYHETPPWEVSASGPFDRWPTHSGFDKFYGFIGGETNQWAPAIFDGVTRVEHEKSSNYHFSVDMTDHAIQWMQAQKALTPEKPFYVYFAPGATHAPHHVPKEYADRHKGEFDSGWDALREATFKRQKEMGVVPADAKLTARPKEIPAWDSLTPAQKKLFARQMEVYAGFAEHIDEQVGRLVTALEGMNQIENTLFMYILGDNGASAEGGPEGTYNETMALNGVIGKAEEMLPHLEEWGSPSTFPHFSIGWAHAANTPFQWTKQVASHFGGTRNGMIVHWPQKVKAKGEVRTQFTHVVDVAPTVLEAVGLPFPKKVNGVEQTPFNGTSLAYTFEDKNAPERHTTQYFEMFANRAIYHDGWVAATRHSIPWLNVALPPVSEDEWELYDVRSDFSQSNNLAQANPAKLKELQRKFDEEAIKNHVYPLDDRRIERFNPEMAGRPDLIGKRKELTLYPGMTGLMENAFINIKSRSYAIEADVEVSGDDNGVIIAQAGRFGGWSLYAKDGEVVHEYNFFGLERTKVSSDGELEAGKHKVRYEFKADAHRPGTGGKGTLFVDGEKKGEVTIPKTHPFMYSADEGVDIGVDGETVVSNDYEEGNNEFTGKIVSVTVSQLD
jgi:arylsulfatase A-like enzyme